MIEVLAGGTQTTIQDLGRFGYRASGVPMAGPMDRFALAAANRLVANDLGAAGLETLFGGLALQFDREAVIAVTGGDLGAMVDDQPLPMWTPVAVQPRAIVRFRGRIMGARAYLAVAGAIEGDTVLGSASTYLPGGWGGFQGRSLQRGDTLVVGPAATPVSPGRWLPPEHRPAYSPFPTLRCVPGPHAPLFTEVAAAFYGDRSYRMTPAVDRMGYRLEGPSVMPSQNVNLPSLGVIPGVIQVPPHGQPILLMADAQTTGGYPIIATVIGADLPLAAQLLPGDQMLFRLVSVAEAIAALRLQHRALLMAWEHDELMGVPI